MIHEMNSAVASMSVRIIVGWGVKNTTCFNIRTIHCFILSVQSLRLWNAGRNGHPIVVISLC